MESSSTSSAGQPVAAAPLPPAPVRRVASHELLGARGELIIVHDGRDYRLRVTQNGKLILTA